MREEKKRLKLSVMDPPNYEVSLDETNIYPPIPIYFNENQKLEELLFNDNSKLDNNLEKLKKGKNAVDGDEESNLIDRSFTSNYGKLFKDHTCRVSETGIPPDEKLMNDEDDLSENGEKITLDECKNRLINFTNSEDYKQMYKTLTKAYCKPYLEAQGIFPPSEAKYQSSLMFSKNDGNSFSRETNSNSPNSRLENDKRTEFSLENRSVEESASVISQIGDDLSKFLNSWKKNTNRESSFDVEGTDFSTSEPLENKKDDDGTKRSDILDISPSINKRSRSFVQMKNYNRTIDQGNCFNEVKRLNDNEQKNKNDQNLDSIKVSIIQNHIF